MKVAQAEAHVISSHGLEEKQTFKIRTNAHAFKILSSGLYSDKVAAPIREIGCNAHDAHIAAGRSHLPFEVKLPNQIDNRFYIKDFGTGLSHDEVMNLYTTYFASTKQESNDFTGAFGLGSKSPFSYTDSFTITSRHNGVSRVYSAHIGNDGAPNIAKMGESPCGDDTGIEISFPVNASDFYSFRDRAQSIFQYFNPLPTIIGSDPIKPLQLTRDFNDFAFIEQGEGIKVKMGNVCYPVVTQELNIQTSTHISDNLHNLKGVLLRLPIGAVQVAASREKLQYDADSQKTIRDALLKVLQQMCLELEKSYNDQMKDDTWANRVDFHILSEQSRRGFWIDEDMLKEAGCKDPAKLYKALQDYAEKLPPALPKARYDLMYKDRSLGCFRYKKETESILLDKNFKDLTIVHGTESYGRDRIKKAVIDGTLEGAVFLVVPRRKEKGTQADVEDMVRIIEKQFKGLTKHKLESFDSPITGKRKKALKKGQLPPLPQFMEDMVDKVYVNQQVEKKWSNTKTYWFLDSHTMSESQIYAFEANITKLKAAGITFEEPAKLRRIELLRYRMNLRPEWIGIKEYMTKAMADPDRIDILKKAVGKFKYTIDVMQWRSDSATGLLENMIFFMQREKELFEAIKPVLAKYKVLSIIEDVYKNSLEKAKHAKPQELISAYKAVADLLQIKIDVPEFDAPTVKVDVDFPHAAQIPLRMYRDLYGACPERLPEVLDQILKKG